MDRNAPVSNPLITLSILLIQIWVMSSCSPPPRARKIIDSSSSSLAIIDLNPGGPSGGNGDNGSNNGNQQQGNGFYHCQFDESAYESNRALIGEFTICQSSANSDSFKIMLKTPSPNTSICLVPTTEESPQFFLPMGPKHCFTTTNPHQIVHINLLTRTGAGANVFSSFASAPLDVIYVMKDQNYQFQNPVGGPLAMPTAFENCFLLLATSNPTSASQYCNSVFASYQDPAGASSAPRFFTISL